MELMQRFGCQYTDEYVDAYIAEMVKHPGCCDTVWLPTSYNYPTLEMHRAYADCWLRAAEKLRKNGFKVSLQVSNTIGHGDRYTPESFAGLVFEGSPVKFLVGPDGWQSKSCFCPRGQFFRDYTAEYISYYAECQPDVIWVDDDLRPTNHGRVKQICFCDDCISAFNSANGVSFNREELVRELLHGDLLWREKWIAFTREGIAEFVKYVGKRVKKTAPNAIFSYQHGAYGAYTGYSLDYVYDAMLEVNGGVSPMCRPGGGAYDDHDPNMIIRKAMSLAHQKAMLPPYVKRSVPEVENLPFQAFGKSPAGTMLESSLYFAMGHTDASYSMIMRQNEPMAWHGKEFKLFAEHRPYWERLSAENLQSYGAGIHYFRSKGVWQKKLGADEGLEELNQEPYREILDIARDAIPYTYDNEEKSIFFLHPETAKYVTADELDDLLARPVITDGESIDILQKRGFDFGLSCVRLEGDYDGLFERFYEHSVKPEGYDSFLVNPYGKGNRTKFAMARKEGMEIISRYDTKNSDLSPIFDDKEAPYGASEMIYPTERGAKWAILSYAPWYHNIPTYKRDMILDIADYISKNALPARLLTPVPCVLMPRRRQDGRVSAVSVLNCTVGKSGEMELLVRDPVGEKFTFMSQYNGSCKVEFEKRGEDYILRVPSIDAWSVGTVFAQ